MDKVKIQHILVLALFYLGVFLELALQTFWMGKLGPYASPVVWLAGGLMSCCAAMFLVGFKKSPMPVSVDEYQLFNNALLILSILLFCALIIAVYLSGIFHKYPSHPLGGSDIVPSLKVYVKRFYSGEKVYESMNFPGWTVTPTYLPMMWMPYSFSEWLDFDYRWTPYLIFVLAIYLYNLKLVHYDTPAVELAIKGMLPFLFLLMFILYQEQVFGYAVELLPVGFYLVLTLTIFNRSNILVGIGILICLLSRYAFTFWLPFYLLVIWLECGFKDVVRVGITVLLGILILYIIPFWIKDPEILRKGLDYYDMAALWQWQAQSWQHVGEKPFILNRGMGFAIYFYDFVKGDVTARLALNEIVHLIASGTAALLILLGYLRFRNHGLNSKIYLLVSLKFYLLIFYGFFQVPFSYLYILPLFLSFPLIFSIPLRDRLIVTSQ